LITLQRPSIPYQSIKKASPCTPRFNCNMALHGHSAACCNVPAVEAHGYKPKGKYIEIDGLKTYTTGPSSAKKGIFVVYDIFGFSDQGIQGADILANSDAEQAYQVFVPDVLKGEYAEHSWFPPDTDEKKQKMGALFGGPAAPPKTAALVLELMKTLKEKTGISTWGVIGYCWGGKIVSLASKENTPFQAGAECHPAMVDPTDAKDITIPICLLASKDEDPQAVEGFEKAATKKGHVETFGDQIHGWMAARADLDNPRVKAEYERGYKTVLEFFHENL